jgi:hypothetical protein
MLKRTKGNPYLQGFGLAGSPKSDREVSIYTCNQYNTIQRYNKRVPFMGHYAFAFRVVLSFGSREARHAIRQMRIMPIARTLSVLNVACVGQAIA